MNTKKRAHKDSAEKAVRDIRRATRRIYQQKRRSVLYWRVYAVKTALLNCAGKKALTRICITAGRRSFWRRARILPVVAQLTTTNNMNGLNPQY